MTSSIEEHRSETRTRKHPVLRVAVFLIVSVVFLYLGTRWIVLVRSTSTVSTAEGLLRSGQVQDARKQLSWLLYFDPQCPEAKLITARCDVQSGDLSLAIENLHSLFPDSSQAEPAGELLARCLLDEFRVEEAEAVLSQLVARFPDSEYAWEELRWLYFNQFRTREVESLLQQQLRRGVSQDYALMHLLMSEFRPPVPREGIGYLESIEQLRPGQLPVVRALAYCAWQLGELDRAQDAFQQALRESPEDPQTLLWLGEFALEQNRLELAHSLIALLGADGVTAGIEEDQRHWIRAQLFEREMKLPEALQEVTRALELRPFELKYAYQKATLLSRLGQMDQAEQAYQAAKTLESTERAMAEIVLSGRLAELSIDQALEIADLYESRNREELAGEWRVSVNRHRRKVGE